MKNFKLLPVALLALSPGVFAQQIPSAGSVIQQIPPAPARERAAPSIRLEPAAAVPATPAPSDAVKITVQRLRVTGATAYGEDELVALTGFVPGSELSLAELQGLALKITERYRNAGYVVAQAYLPPQEIAGGVVTIAVVEGRYGKISVRNASGLSDGVVTRALSGIDSGAAIVIAPLESGLLLLSDIPGVTVTSTLAPGTQPGTSDLIVDVAPGRSVTGSVEADNAGNRYTGPYRVGATVYLNNAAGLGDLGTLRVLTSGKGLNYARASYQVPFGRATVGVAYSALAYELGREFEPLGATGTARIASVYGSYALIRSRNTNLYAGLGFDHKTYQDKSRTDLGMPVADKTVQVLTASLRGDHRDTLGAGGVSGFELGFGTGRVDLQTPQLQFRNAASQSSGHFNKLTFSAMRLQGITETISLFAGINGQAASKNLDVSEKMQLGGMYGVRAYPEGEAYADQGYVLTLEARMALPRLWESQRGQLQLIGFVDTGSATLNKKPWTSGDNRRTLSGAGVGLNWSEANNFMVRAYYAHKLGDAPALSAPDRSGRFWVQAVKYF